MDKVWQSFTGCPCLQTALIKSGYADFFSLETINENSLAEIEQYISQEGAQFWDSNASSSSSTVCNHVGTYKNQDNFEFLPGHRRCILNWCSNLRLREKQITDPSIETFSTDHPAFKPVLREIVSSALGNQMKTSNRNRYSDIVHDFGTYIYMLGGKKCYEIMSANIQIPALTTIREYHTV